MKISPEQVIAARKLLGWSQADLALMAGVTESAVRHFERRTRVPWGASLAAIKKALESAGVEFIASEAVRPSLRGGGRRATIMSDANGASVRVRKEFRSFSDALRYYVTVLSRNERDVCYIATVDGKVWRRSDLLALYRPSLSRPDEGKE